MNTYQLEALAPLVFRSGKPFGAQAGADGANFPAPASLAGLMRTLHADRHGIDFGDPAALTELRALPSRGPLLARRSTNGAITALLPRPADALYLRDEEADEVQVVRLQPMPMPAGAGCDLPAGLLPVGLTRELKGKPAPGPQFWPLPQLQAWQQGQAVDFKTLENQGLQSLDSEQRTHVALNDDNLAAEAGKLFQTSGLDLAARRQAAHPGGWADHDFVFLARSAADLQPGLATFGGERRLSRLKPARADAWPRPVNGLRESLSAARGLALTLATPAIFSGGYRPGWLDAHRLEGSPPGCDGLQLRLRAAAVERWQPISGWDLAAHKPKAMRKAVAAGAVYWFEILAGNPGALLEDLWLAPLSDHPQDRHDGFGLVLPAPWSPL